MEKKMKFCLLTIILLINFSALYAQINMKLELWQAEDYSGKAKIGLSCDTLDIITPKGMTLWYKKRLTGQYEIRYKACMVMKGGEYDRLSDLNCFWGANDPKYPENLFARGKWRNGFFPNYKTLKLFYVGYGGNNNSTTRFRRYLSGLPEQDDNQVRPLIKEYKDKKHLLEPNKWYDVCIKVEKEMTYFYVNNELLFSHRLNPCEADGHFGIRLLSNHVKIADFKILDLK